MKLYIPEIGDQFVLSSDWKFTLHNERRNETLMKKLNWEFKWYPERDGSDKTRELVISKGTTLKVDRIYIRKGNSDYSSLTFFIGSGDWKGCRFWAKLSDVNNIEFDDAKPVETSIKVTHNSYLPPQSQVGKIFTNEQYENYASWQSKLIDVKIDGKTLVEIKPYIKIEPLPQTECDALNLEEKKQRKLRSWITLHKYTPETHVKITQFDFVAYVKETGELIGKSQVSTGITKKIKDYYKKKSA